MDTIDINKATKLRFLIPTVRWLQGATRKEDVAIYHRGLLSYDKESEFSYLEKHERRILTIVSSFLMEACEKGYCYLLQKKNGEGDYYYIAVRRKLNDNEVDDVRKLAQKYIDEAKRLEAVVR